MTSDGDPAGSRLPEATDTRFTIVWDKTTVALEAIERALYALADQVTGTITDTRDSWSLTAHPRRATAEPDALAHRIRQEVNDQNLRVKIAERTDPVRNLVFALAFSRSGLVEGNADT